MIFSSYLNVRTALVSLVVLSAALGSYKVEAMMEGDEDAPNKTQPQQLHIEDIPSEVMLSIFSHLGQNDIPNVTRTCKEWNTLMGDNHLWAHFARKAGIVNPSDPIQPEADYKALVKFYSTPSFNIMPPPQGQLPLSPLPVTICNNSASVSGLYIKCVSAEPRYFTWNPPRSPSMVTVENEENFREYSINSSAGKHINPTVYCNGKSVVFEPKVENSNEWTLFSISKDNEGEWRDFKSKSEDLNNSISFPILKDSEGGEITLCGGSLNGSQATWLSGLVNQEDNSTGAYYWTPESGRKDFKLSQSHHNKILTFTNVTQDKSFLIGNIKNSELAFPQAIRISMNNKGIISPEILDESFKCSTAEVTNFDGSIIGGQTTLDGDTCEKLGLDSRDHAFLWTQKDGMQLVKSILENNNNFPAVLKNRVTITNVTAMSHNGSYIAGTAQLSDPTKILGWRAVLPPKRPLF